MGSTRKFEVPELHPCDEHTPWVRPLIRGGLASRNNPVSPECRLPCRVCSLQLAGPSRLPLDVAIRGWLAAIDRLDEELFEVAELQESTAFASTWYRLARPARRVAKARAAVRRELIRWLSPFPLDECSGGANAPLRCEGTPVGSSQEGPPEATCLDEPDVQRSIRSFIRRASVRQTGW